MKYFVMTMTLACFALPLAAQGADHSEVDRQVLGAWQLQFAAPDGVQRTPVVVVGRQYDSYLAWYVNDDKLQPFRDVRLEGDRLVGKIRPQEEPDVTVSCEASLKADDCCKGTATYRNAADGASGSFAFTGERVPLSSFDDVETWKLDFVTPDNQQYSATVTVVSKDGKLFAWYSDPEHELPACSVSVEGDQVEMKMAAESPKGTPVEVTFRGTASDDEVQGNAEYRVGGDSGTFPFKAKRAS